MRGTALTGPCLQVEPCHGTRSMIIQTRDGGVQADRSYSKSDGWSWRGGREEITDGVKSKRGDAVMLDIRSHLVKQSPLMQGAWRRLLVESTLNKVD